VGFGCSQVLPVLTAGLNLFADDGRETNRILLVQEPEIHLHPNAQAALGSFFVNLVQTEGQVFIETHSDSLVLRIARHVAMEHIKPSDVSIFFVSDELDNRVVPISITEDGRFDPEWPGGFFPQRQIESFELARAAAGIPRRSARQLAFSYPEER
jgi:predicted ATPase